MSAIEQVFTIGIVKDEHPRLYVEAVTELTQLRAALATAERERDEARARVAALEAKSRTAVDVIKAAIDQKYTLTSNTPLDGYGVEVARELISDIELEFELSDDMDTLTPRRYVTCAQEAAREMRDNAESICRDWNRAPYLAGSHFGGDSIPFVMRFHLADAIAALPLPSCGDCNPLKPEAENEATR